MAFLQPWMLWALPAVLLPLVIHLLNRLRYKTVPWAAMMFLLKANKSATRRAKIRQYLLLLARMLVLFFLIWAMTRPMTGGWIGSAAGSGRECVVILLDRSASMEAAGPDRQDSKREHALKLLSQAAKQNPGSRFVLIENVTREPLDVADASNLANLQTAGPTDTTADIPAMMRAGLEYLTKNRVGSAEIWIASDLQETNWRPDSPEWQDISARFAGLPQDTQVRIIDLSSAPGKNTSVSLKNADLKLLPKEPGKGQLSVLLELAQSEALETKIPAFITRDGAKSQQDLAINGATQRQNLKYELPKVDPAGGWGRIDLPADDNNSDNSAYFVYAPPVPLLTTIVGDHPSLTRVKFAAAPGAGRPDRSAELLPPASEGLIKWKETALLVWQAGAPGSAAAKQIQSFVESGGILLCLPPANDATTSGPMGVAWNIGEKAPPEEPMRVTVWDEVDGPLAKTENGQSLAVAQLEISKRQSPAQSSDAHVFAAMADGKPFLSGRKVGAGHVFALATLPEQEWSSMDNGFVLLPLVQRLLTLGGLRLSPPKLGTAGQWKPSDDQETWTSLGEERRDWRWQAGIYQTGTRLVALNRPSEEDNADQVPKERLDKLIPNAKLKVMAGALEMKVEELESEIWPMMILLCMIFMSAEMLLATSKALLPARATVKPAPAKAPTTEVTA